MNPAVSVIIPAYRSEKTVEQSVRSALEQTLREIEVIAVNDASDDGTGNVLAALAAEDARVRVVTFTENRGVAAARNCGMELARAPWIAFLDSDDVWLPEKLEKQLALAQRSGADVLYTAAACIDEDGKPSGRVFRVPGTVTFRDMKYQNDLICSTALVRRECCLSHPMADGDLHEDYLFWLEILRDGAKTAGLDEALALYRIRKRSKSGNKLRSAGMVLRTYRRFGFGLFQRIACFAGYCLHGVKRYWL